MIEKVLIKARQEVHAELFKGQVNNRRASLDIKKIRDKYRDELSSHIKERRKEEAIQITPNVTLPPSMTYPMTP
jgi:non-homologous end joining protein Ku